MADQFSKIPYDKPADNCVAFMQINVSDLARAQKFYTDVFGWVFQSQPYQSTIVVFKTAGQVMGALHVGKEAGAVAEGAVLNYIKVADVAETLDKVRAAGGEVVKEKWTEGNHTDMGEFTDTEGNSWGVLHWLI